MTPRGPCPVFKGIPFHFNYPCCSALRFWHLEIGERLGPFDLAMIPIWRGGTLGFISQLGFRVRLLHTISMPVILPQAFI